MMDCFNCQLKYIQLSTQTCVNVSNKQLMNTHLCACK